MKRLLARAVLALVALQLLASGVVATKTTVIWIRDGVRDLGDAPDAALRRVSSTAYADGLAAVRARVPLDATYLAVDADPERRHAELVWLRYDLAPRKGEYLGRLVDGRLVDRQALPPDLPPFVVVSYGDGRRPPRVEATRAFLAACVAGSAR